MMEGSKVSMRTWYLAMAFMSFGKKGISAAELQRQAQVAVMAESTPLEDLDTGECSRHCRYFKMKVIRDHSSSTVIQLIKENFDEKSIVFSDTSSSYVYIAQHVETHITEKSDGNTTRTTLQWMHIAISTAKQLVDIQPSTFKPFYNTLLKFFAEDSPFL